MAQIVARHVRLKTGEGATLRSPEPRDARPLIGYMADVLANSPYMIRTPAEHTTTVRREKAWIRRQNALADELIVVAEQAGHIVGMLDTSTEKRRRLRHSTAFGLSVHPGWRQRGLGRALVATLVDWAVSNPRLERIELHVHSGNQPAIALYESMGFREQGRRPGAIKYEDGRYMDDVLMWRPATHAKG